MKKIISLVLALAMLLSLGSVIACASSEAPSAETTPADGWVKDDYDDWHYYKDNTMLISDWVYYAGNWYYLNEYGIMQTGFRNFDNGDSYYFDKDGTMHTGWLCDGSGYRETDTWYYYDANGRRQTGWLYYGGAWYYLDPSDSGAMVTGMYGLPEYGSFCFSDSGAMQTGWVYNDDGWYYFDANGCMQTGWLYIGGAWYYLNELGIMLEDGIYDIDGYGTFCFSAGGAMQTGWVYKDNFWYHFDANGCMDTGWLYDGGTWYYLDEFGMMLADAVCEVPGCGTCSFDASGAWTGYVTGDAGQTALNGWVYDSDLGVRFYYKDNVKVVDSWLYYGSNWYYLGSDGVILADGMFDIDGCGRFSFAENGTMQTGWVMYEDGWYYFDANGYMQTGWIHDDFAWYYLNDSGLMLSGGTYEVPGYGLCSFDASGAWTGYVTEDAGQTASGEM